MLKYNLVIVMDESRYKIKKITYEVLAFVLFLFSILILILSLVLINRVLLVISIVFIVISVLYLIFLNKLINSIKNRYKELLISDAFTVHNFLYVSRQKTIKKNKYAIYKEEFENLNYYKANDDFKYVINELVVGDIRTIDFRAEDYAYVTSVGNKKKCGRIYSFNLKSDPSFKLVITKDDYSTSLSKLDLNLLKYNFYTNNQQLALKYIHEEKFIEKIAKIESYGSIFIEINNSSLYLIIDGIKESFVIENREYNDISEDVDRELFIMNNIIESFDFSFKPKKVKELKIK